MWPFTSSVESLVKGLRKAEHRLLDLAKTRFDEVSAFNVAPFDTLIPSTVVPVKNPRCCICSTQGDDDHLNIHAVRVSGEAKESVSATAASRSPLVLLHGYMNGASYFYRNFAGLSRYFDSIYSLDLLGWGLSSRPRFTLKDSNMTTAEDFFVESLEAWRAKNQIEKMTLAGHSLGGYVGVAYCERYPQHVERLILISPAGVSPETEEIVLKRRARQASSWRWRIISGIYSTLFYPYFSFGNVIRMAPAWSQRMIHEYIEKRVPDIRNEDERDAVATYLFLNSMLPGSGEYCLSRFLNPYGFGRNPTENRIPYLKISHVSFLYGENDWMDVEGGLNVQTLCEEQSDRQAPSIDVFQVKNAGHLLMLDNWREFNVGMALSAGLTPKCDEARPIKLVPGQFVRGENEIETMTHRSPSTNTPI